MQGIIAIISLFLNIQIFFIRAQVVYPGAAYREVRNVGATTVQWIK
jgi:hypothetical protein